MTTAADWADVPYISLRSFRRNGSPVDTPVWCAVSDGGIVVFTLRDSYKVKRIARNPAVQIATCDMRGGSLGPWHSGTCKAVPDGSAEEARAYEALTAKYGWKMRIGNFFSALTGRKARRVVLAVSLA
jgi:PPOX class probable F420-dependent enzyme